VTDVNRVIYHQRGLRKIVREYGVEVETYVDLLEAAYFYLLVSEGGHGGLDSVIDYIEENVPPALLNTLDSALGALLIAYNTYVHPTEIPFTMVELEIYGSVTVNLLGSITVTCPSGARTGVTVHNPFGNYPEFLEDE